MQSDQHHIFDLNSRERINKGKDILVGNHVWLGRETMLLGGAKVADNCVVGARSTFSGSFEKKIVLLRVILPKSFGVILYGQEIL